MNPSTYSIKAVLFDLDGVVIDSNPFIEAFWKKQVEIDRKGDELTNTVIRRWIHGRKVGDTLQGLFNHVSEIRKQEIQDEAYIFDQSMNPDLVIGVKELLLQLHAIQIPVGLVTSSHFERMWQMLERTGIDHLFTSFVTAHDVSKGKPDPEPYLTMSSKLQIHPAECLVFEDAVSGIRSAVDAGMQAIGIGDPTAFTDLINEGAVEMIPDFNYIHIQNGALITTNGNFFQFK